MPSKLRKRKKQQKEIYEKRKRKLGEDFKRKEAFRKRSQYAIHPSPQKFQSKRYRQSNRVKVWKTKKALRKRMRYNLHPSPQKRSSKLYRLKNVEQYKVREAARKWKQYLTNPSPITDQIKKSRLRNNQTCSHSLVRGLFAEPSRIFEPSWIQLEWFIWVFAISSQG